MKKASAKKGKSRKPSTQDSSPVIRKTKRERFPIGVGTAASGLEAFSALLSNLPEKPGMAFVFVQHLDPSHTSALREILSRTKIPVTEVTDGVVVQCNHVYVIPPDTNLVLSSQDIDALQRTLDETRLFADVLIETAREAILVLDAKLRVVVANRAFYNSFKISASETESQLIYDLGNKQWDIPRLRELLGDIASKNSRVDDFEVRHDFPHLGERIMMLNARRIEPRGGHRLILLSIQDITKERNHSELLSRHAALIDLTSDALIVRTMDGTIEFWNRGAEEMYGWKKEQALGKKTYDLLRTQFPVPFQQLEQELRRTGRWHGELVHATQSGHDCIVSSRWTLLEQQGGEPTIFETNTDIRERKNYEENLRQLSGHLMRVQDEERRRIARDLHDSTGQKLAAAKLHLDTMVRKSDLRAHQQSLTESAQLVDEAFQEIRTLSQILHPPLLDETGLISATRWLVDGFSARAKIPVEFKISGEQPRLPQAVELALFRVIQESLNNIHRHAAAKKARIELTQTEEKVILQVHDNGKGIPPGLLSSSRDGKHIMGVGILGMKERLSQLGGTLEIEASKNGTTVRATLPHTKAASSSA